MTREQFIMKLKEYIKTFKPTVKPACANFVSRAFKNLVDEDILEVNYVPSFNLGREMNASTRSDPGDVIIFNGTYDALFPSGIGPEDTMTHIGIVVEDRGMRDIDFIHYSWGQDRPLLANLVYMPSPWSIYSFRDMSQYFDEEEVEFECNVILEGKEYPVDSIELTLKFNGKVVKLFGHK